MTKFIPYSLHTGIENMQIDAQILEDAISQNLSYPIFRLYGWFPHCISLGRNQRDDFLDYKLLQKNNIDVVRRLTGGRALLHADEITYSYVCPISYLKQGENITSSYMEICEMLIEKFCKIGIKLDFGGKKSINTHYDYCMLISTGADLCYQGKKLIGSAQCRKHGYILQHGSILYSYDRLLLEKIFKESVSTDDITSISEISSAITRADIIKILSST